MTHPLDDLLSVWTVALPRVLGLLPGTQSRMFRGELQRFLALRRMQPAEADALVAPLRELLLQSVRTAEMPPALHATRTHLTSADTLQHLIEHILASWRDAEAAAKASSACEPAADPSGRTGSVFFGPRLGGPGRRGAVTADGEPEDR